MTLDELVVRYTAKVVRRHNGNRTTAADELGICVRSVRDYLHKFAEAHPDKVCNFTRVQPARGLRPNARPLTPEQATFYAERERERILNMRDKHQSRKYKIRGV